MALARASKHKRITCLITGSKKPLSVWPRQIPQHLNIKYKLYTKIEALEKARNAEVEGAQGDTTLEILTLSLGSLAARIDKLIELGVNFIILDESHETKNPLNISAKALARLSRTVEYCLILTGTPRGNIDIDFFSQFNIMDHTIFSNWWAFRDNFCEAYGFEQRKYRIKASKRKVFLDIIASKSFFMDEYKANKKLKPEIEHIIKVKLTGYAKQHYHNLSKSMHSQLDNIRIKDDLAASSIFRLQQLCGGFMKVDGRVIQLEQDKLIALIELVNKFKDEKLVIFAKYLEEIQIISKALGKLGYTYGVIKGGSKANVWYDFQDKPDPQIMVCQIKSGGTGIDLFAACKGIYYSNSYSYIDYDQSKKRLNRRGQTKQVEFFHLIIEDSIDIAILNSLKDKNTTSQEVFKYLIRSKQNG